MEEVKKASSVRGVAVETLFIACCPAVKSTLGKLNRGGGLHQGGGWQEVLIVKSSLWVKWLLRSSLQLAAVKNTLDNPGHL